MPLGIVRNDVTKMAVDTIGEFLMENDMTVYSVIFHRAAY